MSRPAHITCVCCSRSIGRSSYNKHLSRCINTSFNTSFNQDSQFLELMITSLELAVAHNGASKCPLCRKWETNIREHIPKCGVVSGTEKCPKGCGDSFNPNSNEFLVHIATCKTGGVRRMCNLCGFMIQFDEYDEHVTGCTGAMKTRNCPKCSLSVFASAYSAHLLNCTTSDTRQCPKCYVWLFDNVYMDHFAKCRPDADLCIKCEKWIQPHQAITHTCEHTPKKTFCSLCMEWIDIDIYECHKPVCVKNKKCVSCSGLVPRDLYLDHYIECTGGGPSATPSMECPYCECHLHPSAWDAHLTACFDKFDNITCTRCKLSFNQIGYEIHCVGCPPETCTCGEVDPTSAHKSKCTMIKCPHCTYMGRTSSHIVVHTYHRHPDFRRSLVSQYLEIIDTSVEVDLDMGEIEISPPIDPITNWFFDE